MIAGADEAGRGCVLGPLVLCVAVATEQGERKLREAGVKDSKLLSPKRRESLEKEILCVCKQVKVEKVSAQQLNDLMKRFSLNEIEAMFFGTALNSVKANKIFIDCPDTRPERFEDRMRKYYFGKAVLVAEHKADQNHPVVSAASVIAKLERDREIEALKKLVGFDFGSGYSSDERTVKFLKENLGSRLLKGHVRTRWVTVERLSQKTLADF